MSAPCPPLSAPLFRVRNTNVRPGELCFTFNPQSLPCPFSLIGAG